MNKRKRVAQLKHRHHLKKLKLKGKAQAAGPGRGLHSKEATKV